MPVKFEYRPTSDADFAVPAAGTRTMQTTESIPAGPFFRVNSADGNLAGGDESLARLSLNKLHEIAKHDATKRWNSIDTAVLTESGRIDVVVGGNDNNTPANGKIYLYRNDDDSGESWLEVVVDESSIGAIQGLQVANIAGEQVIIATDQVNGTVLCYTRHASGDITEAWTKGVIGAGYSHAIQLLKKDIDGDGDDELFFCWEGTTTNQGGFVGLKYKGSGSLTDSASWDFYSLATVEGLNRLAYYGDDDFASAARGDAGRNNDPAAGVYILRQPSPWYDPWGVETVIAGSPNAGWTSVSVVDGGSGERLDVLAGLVTGTTGLRLFRHDDSWSSTTLPTFYGAGEKPQSHIAVSLSNSDRDDIVCVVERSDGQASAIVAYQWTGSIYGARRLTYDGAAHPADDRFVFADLNGDGRDEIVFPSSGNNRVAWMDIRWRHQPALNYRRRTTAISASDAWLLNIGTVSAGDYVEVDFCVLQVSRGADNNDNLVILNVRDGSGTVVHHVLVYGRRLDGSTGPSLGHISGGPTIVADLELDRWYRAAIKLNANGSMDIVLDGVTVAAGVARLNAPSGDINTYGCGNNSNHGGEYLISRIRVHDGELATFNPAWHVQQRRLRRMAC